MHMRSIAYRVKLAIMHITCKITNAEVTMWYISRRTPWHRRELLNKALTLFDTVKKHCNSTFKIWSYLRLSTDQYDQLNLMEKNPRSAAPHIWVLLGLAAFTFPESVQKQHKNRKGGVVFSHSRANSSYEQTGVHLRLLHRQRPQSHSRVSLRDWPTL